MTFFDSYMGKTLDSIPEEYAASENDPPQEATWNRLYGKDLHGEIGHEENRQAAEWRKTNNKPAPPVDREALKKMLSDHPTAYECKTGLTFEEEQDLFYLSHHFDDWYEVYRELLQEYVLMVDRQIAEERQKNKEDRQQRTDGPLVDMGALKRLVDSHPPNEIMPDAEKDELLSFINRFNNWQDAYQLVLRQKFYKIMERGNAREAELH